MRRLLCPTLSQDSRAAGVPANYLGITVVRVRIEKDQTWGCLDAGYILILKVTQWHDRGRWSSSDWLDNLKSTWTFSWFLESITTRLSFFFTGITSLLLKFLVNFIFWELQHSLCRIQRSEHQRFGILIIFCIFFNLMLCEKITFILNVDILFAWIEYEGDWNNDSFSV